MNLIEQGWTKDEAIQEMVKGGYGFHKKWRNIIEYVKDVDVDRIRNKVEKGGGQPLSQTGGRRFETFS